MTGFLLNLLALMLVVAVPALSQIDSGDARRIWGRPISSAAPASGNVLTWNAGTSVWEPSSPAPSGITQLTGDVTAGPGSGSQVATIANNAVTLAKMADIATGSVLGRSTGGTGDPEVLTTLPTGVQDNITRLGTITVGVWNGTDIAVADGGTGASTAQAAINTLSGLTINGDLLYHNGTNVVRLARGSDTQVLTATATSIQWAAPGSLTQSCVANAQTGTSYTFLTGDRAKCVTGTNAGTQTYVLPNAGASFPDGWYVIVKNLGAGDLVINRDTTSTIDGATTLTLSTGEWLLIRSDGTNYETVGHRLAAGSGITLTKARSNITILSDTAVMLSRATDQAGTDKYCAPSGGTDTYACNLTPALGAYTAGMSLVLNPDVNNTGAASLNVNGLGAVNLKVLSSGAKADPSDNDIDADGVYWLFYDGTDFIVVPTAKGTSSGLGDPGGNGIVVRTALNTTTNRTIVSGAPSLVLTDGNGVSGNPSIDTTFAPRKESQCLEDMIFRVSITNNGILGTCGFNAMLDTGASMATSGTVLGTATEQGWTQWSTGTGSTAFAGFSQSESSTLFGGGTYHFAAKVKFPTLSDGTETYQALVGYFDTTTITPVDGVYCRYSSTVNSGEWECVTRSNSTESVLDTNVAVVADTAYVIEIKVNAAGTSVEYIINGTSAGTITTNIPTGAGRVTGQRLMIIKSAGTTARTMDVGFVGQYVRYTNDR